MKFGIERRARSRKARSGLRALFGGGPPDAREVGERLVRLARRMFKEAVTDASPKRITLALHPAAPPARLLVLPEGELELRAETATVGPGYHVEILERLAPILEELEYVWDDSGEGGEGEGGEGGEGERGDPGPRMLAWLAGELSGGATRVGMPAARSFRVDCAVQTAMGPRDAAWREAVIADPARGADAFAWWERGPGRREQARALLAMWHEVAWREPLDDDERAVLARVDADLAAAHRADPALALPWLEWAELLGYLGEDGEHADLVRERAREVSGGGRGRRRAADRLPPSPDGDRALGRLVDRAVRRVRRPLGDRRRSLVGHRRGARGRVHELHRRRGPDSEQLLAIAPEAHSVIERLADGDRRGRAEVTADGDVHLVHGLMARAPHVAILTCKGAASDEAWALATWRSLRNG